jgi:hypothetical protein
MKTTPAFAFVTIATIAPVWLAACAVDATGDARKEETAAIDQALGEPPKCFAYLPDGSPNPAWPECLGTNGPTIPSPTCSGYASCYCRCRYFHRCDQNPAECGPLDSCLYDCDAQYPTCPYPGGEYPPNLLSCYRSN